MKLGIIGLPYCGKTTLFEALTSDYSPTGKVYIDGNTRIDTAVVKVPDQRLDWLSKHYQPKKVSHANITFQDISGIHEEQKGLSKSLLHVLTQIDGFIHVVQCFNMSNEGINEKINLLLDDFTINDIMTIERKLENLSNEWTKGGGRNRSDIEYEQNLFNKMHDSLETKSIIDQNTLSINDQKLLSGYGFLTTKPMLIVLNCDEYTYESINTINITNTRINHNIISLMGKLEMEIAQLNKDDASVFMQEYGMTTNGLDQIIQLSYDILELKSFFTVGQDEVKAWTIHANTIAQDAAGTIHSDMNSGFIRAETMSFDDLQNLGSEGAVKSAGKLRLEGKEYVVQDGDILKIRFSPPKKNSY